MFRSNRAIWRSVTSVIFIVSLAGAATADTLSPEWQKKRDAGNALTDRACGGDKAAKRTFWAKVKSGDPVLQNNLSWLAASCRDFKHLTPKQVADYALKSALAGYPLGMANYGARLVRGLGAPKDSRMGVSLLERSLRGGYGRAASTLAMFYADGKHLPRNLEKARSYLKIAEREGVSPKVVKERRERIAKAEAAVAKKPKQAQQNKAPPKYAALVVSTSDGGFGWAHDHPTEATAKKRATQECRQRGGKDCNVKMVGYGKGCMAYHYAGASATAHGWAMGPTRQAVETRAARECQKRNNGSSCSGTSWVCNDRKGEAFRVIYEAPLPSIATASGQGCYIFLSHKCSNFTNGTHKGKRFATITVRAFPKLRIKFPDCGTSNKNKGVTWDWTKNALHKYSDRGVPKNIKQQSRRILQAYRSAVRRAFPKCRKPKRYSESGSVQFVPTRAKYQEWRNRLSKPAPWNRVISFEPSAK